MNTPENVYVTVKSKTKVTGQTDILVKRSRRARKTPAQPAFSPEFWTQASTTEAEALSVRQFPWGRDNTTEVRVLE